jgi:hypothetical protein
MLGLIVTLVAAGCGSGTTELSEAPPPDPVRFSVGVLVPLTGPAADSGRGALESVRRVVAQREQELQVAGLQVDVTAADDRGQQSVGQQQATTLADDPSTMAIIGSTESRVDEGVQPILAGSGLVTMSLGGSEPTLTRTVARQRPAFGNYVTLSAQRLDRARVAATLPPREATALVLRGPRREDAAMAEVFVRSRVLAQSPRPTVRRLPALTADGFEPSGEVSVRTLVQTARPDAVYVVADQATEWATIVSLRAILRAVPIIADEDVLGPWPEDPAGAEEEARDSGSPWGPLWTTTSGGTPDAADVAWPPTLPSSPAPTRTAEPSTEAQDEAIRASRFSIAAHDAAQALIDGLLATWADAAPTQREAVATPTGDTGVSPAIVAWRSAVAREVKDDRQRGLLGPYVFDDRGVASRRLVGVYRAVDQTWSERAPREVVGPCGTGACAVRVR